MENTNIEQNKEENIIHLKGVQLTWITETDLPIIKRYLSALRKMRWEKTKDLAANVDGFMGDIDEEEDRKNKEKLFNDGGIIDCIHAIAELDTLIDKITNEINLINDIWTEVERC